MNRKQFLKTWSLSFLGIPSFLTSCMNYLTNVEDCQRTDMDSMGPFYVKGTNQAINLNTKQLPGEPMLIEGSVFKGPGESTPLKNAKIEIWHADAAGAYHPSGSGNVKDYPASEITLRGFVQTDEQGRYSFESIVPGYYGGRPKHIHYKISAGGKKLVTQSYFKGDPKIMEDQLSRNAGDCRIVALEQHQGVQKGTMNFHL